MKKTLGKRALSVFLSAALIVSMFAALDFASYATEYNSYSASYTSKLVDSQYLQAQFNFDSSLSGVDGSGNEISMTVGGGTVQQTSGMGARTGVAYVAQNSDQHGSYAYFPSPFQKTDLSEGATVMFWQYQQHNKENNKFNPVITFARGNVGTGDPNLINLRYVTLTVGGYLLFNDGAQSGTGYYKDYYIDGSEDIVGIPATSTTITSETNQEWCHYAFSITEDSLSIYIGGVRYDWTTKTGTTDSGVVYNGGYDDDVILAHVIDFIQQNETYATIGWCGYNDGNAGTPDSYYVDDVRFYSKALTQLEIRSLYGENDSEVYEYAEGHDPTIVSNVNYGQSGHDGEYKYYMFGTGMTVYGSNDLTNWAELGDSQGRTGYQNEEYWGVVGDDGAVTGANYQTVLTGATTTGTAAPLTWSGKNTGCKDWYQVDTGTGAGKMVWAPSVYYNTTNNKYMMVCSASSWGSSMSCIFTAEADSVEGPYYNITPLMYSGFDETCGKTITGIQSKISAVTGNDDKYKDYLHWEVVTYTKYNSDDYPNCIDPCPFYGKDGSLYMTYGSWSGGIWMVRLSDDGKATDSSWMNSNDYDVYFGVKVAATTNESVSSGSGEGSFAYYDSGSGNTYLNVSYGSVHQAEYTMRVWKTDADCPMAGTYTDVNGNASTTANTDSTHSGMKLMGNYTVIGSNQYYYDNGHCSYLTENGKTFLAYHIRLADQSLTERAMASTNYLNEARVHQVVLNQNGWQCVLPYQYAGETFDQSADLTDQIPGYYNVIDHGEAMSTDYVTSTRYILTASSENTSSGYVSTAAGVLAGEWSVSNNYLTLSINSVNYSGVLLNMQDETGKERLVFSAVGNSSLNTVWGVQAGSLSSDDANFTNPNANLTIDAAVYCHGAKDTYGNSAEWYYGTEIEYGQLNEDDACALTIDSSFEILSVSNHDSTGGYFEVVDKGTDSEGKHVYYLNGEVPNDPNTSDGYDLALDVTYQDSTSNLQYKETVYTWVATSTVPAHAVAAAMRSADGKADGAKKRSVGIAIKLKGSDGAVTVCNSSNYNADNMWGQGNYYSVHDFTSKSLWLGESSEVNNSSHDLSVAFALNCKKIGGLLATYQGSNDTPDCNAGENFGKTVGSYYLDQSLAGEDDKLPSGATIDSDGNWSVTVDIAGVPNYAPVNDDTQYVSNLSLTGGTGATWNAVISQSSNNFTSAASGTLEYALYIGEQSGVPREVYTSQISGNGTQTNLHLNVKFQHTDDSPKATASVDVYADVYVYDKSAVRDALAAAVLLDLDSNRFYTQETWDAFQEAIRVANAYLNNIKNTTTDGDLTVVAGGSTYVVSASGITKDGASIYTADSSASSPLDLFGQYITATYNALFPQELYEEVYQDNLFAQSVISFNGNGYTSDSYTAFTEIYNSIYNDYAQFSRNAVADESKESWRVIVDGMEFLLDENLTAKENYQLAQYNLEMAIASLRVSADYSGLESELSSSKNQSAQLLGLYADTNESGSFELSEDTQYYTVSSWTPYESAYQTASATDAAQTENDLRYTDATQSFTNPVDSSETKSVTTDNITYDEDGNVTGVYSELQNKINSQTAALNDAVNALKYASTDYSAYDAFVIVLGTQDRNAFTTDYLNSDSSVFAVQQKNGSSSSANEYSDGAEETAYTLYQNAVFKNSSDIDAITAALITSLNTANSSTTDRNSYTVTFKVVINGDDSNAVTVKNAETHYYGDTVTLDASSASGFPSGCTCYQWKVTSNTDNTTASVANVSNEYTVRIQSNSTVTAYVTENAPSSGDTVKVVVQDQYGADVQQLILNGNTKIGLSDKTITIGEISYTLSDMPFYTFTGWQVNGRNYNYGSNYTLSDLGTNSDGETVFSARYNLSDTTYTVKLDGTALTEPASILYDTEVTVTSSDKDAYAIVLSENGVYSVASYSNSYKFYANRDMDFYTMTCSDGVYTVNGTQITDAAQIYNLDHKLPFVYSAAKCTDSENSKYTTFNAFSTNTDNSVTITEAGTLYTDQSDLATSEAMLFGAENLNYLKSKTQIDFSNQYSLTIKKSTDRTVYTRAYVKYSYTYTDAKGNSTVVQCIAYGNICEF